MDNVLEEILEFINDLVEELPDKDALAIYDALLNEIEEKKYQIIEKNS